MTLSDLIREYRREHGLSQRQFASACGLSNGYISMLEKNENPKTGQPVTPSLPALKKIADGMGLSLQDLFSNTDDIPVDLLNKGSGAYTEKLPVSLEEDGHNVNVVKIAGRDGRFIEKELNDKQLQALIAFVDLLPDASDDL